MEIHQKAYQVLFGCTAFVPGQFETATGKVRFRGFYGRYAVKVTLDSLAKEFEIDLSKDGQAPHKFTLPISTRRPVSASLRRPIRPCF